jgi:hypothetical protein
MANAILAAGLLAPLAATATEGALEINQACVASGCFPGDAPGFPITIVNSGNYVFTGDLALDNAANSAVSVGVDNVVIDMKGFSISGPNECSGVLDDCTVKGGGGGIVSSVDRRNIVVRNGRISGMGFAGVDIGQQSTIENVVTEHNWRVGIRARAGSTVRDSNSNFNGYLGIEAQNARVIDCSVSDNGQVGFAVGLAIVVRAVATKSGAEGLQDNYGSQIHQSSFVENGEGIHSVNGGTSVFNSTIYANKGSGIFARGDVQQDASGQPVLLGGNTIMNNNGGNASPQFGGGGTFQELSTNFCGNDTTCP